VRTPSPGRGDQTTGSPRPVPLRWRLSSEDEAGALFSSEEIVERHVGTGEYRSMEFLHVNARRIINRVPAASRMPFRHTINAYRGCSHACAYCQEGSTPILMGDGTTRPLAALRRGDIVYGTQRVGAYRRFVRTAVLDHWATSRAAWRVVLEDGTTLVASGEHRYLTNRGWKHVSGSSCGPNCRPHLTTTNELLGTGQFADGPKKGEEYRRGYLCAMVRGDATIGHHHHYEARKGGGASVHPFGLALVDREALDRVAGYLDEMGVPLRRRVFAEATATHRRLGSVFTAQKSLVEAVERVIAWPTEPSEEWRRGFLAGIFDAEGTYSGGVLRIVNKDPLILGHTLEALRRLDLPAVLEPPRPNEVWTVRLTGGLCQHLRFMHLVDPAITRKRDIEGQAIKNQARLRVVAVEPLGVEIPMYDIATGTGDFIANGVVSHNCFARPTHEYLGLGMGEDFERKIVVKVNAVERVEAELRSPRWRGEHIAMGTNTDPYQKAEAKYHLTRGIVEALGRAANPFSILTKSTLVLRDLDVLREAARRADVRLAFSIGTLDRDVWRLTEPGTPPPDKRVDAVRKLNEAGIPCSVLVAPVLPGLSDSEEQLRAVATACAEAGATSVTPIALHLRPGVREHYLGWLGGARPELVELHRERFGRRSYQPEADQQRIRDIVDAALAAVPRPAVAGDREGAGPSWRSGDFATGHEAAAEHDAALERRAGGERPRPGPDQMRLF